MSFYANIIPNFSILIQKSTPKFEIRKISIENINLFICVQVQIIGMMQMIFWWGNENGNRDGNGSSRTWVGLEVGRVMTMVKFYSNFKLVRKVTLVDPFGFKICLLGINSQNLPRCYPLFQKADFYHQEMTLKLGSRRWSWKFRETFEIQNQSATTKKLWKIEKKFFTVFLW